jgi:hypothetical protein
MTPAQAGKASELQTVDAVALSAVDAASALADNAALVADLQAARNESAQSALTQPVLRPRALLWLQTCKRPGTLSLKTATDAARAFAAELQAVNAGDARYTLFGDDWGPPAKRHSVGLTTTQLTRGGLDAAMDIAAGALAIDTLLLAAEVSAGNCLSSPSQERIPWESYARLLMLLPGSSYVDLMTAALATATKAPLLPPLAQGSAGHPAATARESLATSGPDPVRYEASEKLEDRLELELVLVD